MPLHKTILELVLTCLAITLSISSHHTPQFLSLIFHSFKVGGGGGGHVPSHFSAKQNWFLILHFYVKWSGLWIDPRKYFLDAF